jgi:spermidine/putrescine transport system permease protein
LTTPAQARRSSIGWFFLKAITAAVYGFLFLPLLVVVVLSFNASDGGMFPLKAVSLRWFAKLWSNETIVRAFATSVTLGVAAAAIATAVGFLAALALVRHRVVGRKTVAMLITAPLLIPETVLAVGLLLLLRALDLPRTMLLLVAGHVLLTLPFAVLVIQAHLSGLGRKYEEAAASLGATRLSVLREITLPLSLPAVIAALLFTFTISFDNLTASLFWRPSGVQTVPTEIFAMLRDSISPEINALGTVMIVMTITLSLLAGVFGRSLSGKRSEEQTEAAPARKSDTPS